MAGSGPTHAWIEKHGDMSAKSYDFYRDGGKIMQRGQTGDFKPEELMQKLVALKTASKAVWWSELVSCLVERHVVGDPEDAAPVALCRLRCGHSTIFFSFFFHFF